VDAKKLKNLIDEELGIKPTSEGFDITNRKLIYTSFAILFKKLRKSVSGLFDSYNNNFYKQDIAVIEQLLIDVDVNLDSLNQIKKLLVSMQTDLVKTKV